MFIRVYKYGPTEPRYKKELEKILNDYLDLLAEVEKKVSSGAIGLVNINNLISELKTNARFLKIKLDTLTKKGRETY